MLQYTRVMRIWYSEQIFLPRGNDNNYVTGHQRKYWHGRLPRFTNRTVDCAVHILLLYRRARSVKMLLTGGSKSQKERSCPKTEMNKVSLWLHAQTFVQAKADGEKKNRSFPIPPLCAYTTVFDNTSRRVLAVSRQQDVKYAIIISRTVR